LLDHTRQLVEPNLYLKGGIAVFLVQWQVGLGDEGNLLIRSLGAQDVAQAHVLEALLLPDIIVVWTVFRVSIYSSRGGLRRLTC
jgi:hypothetical protein